MAERVEKLTLTVGIAKSEHHNFADRGSFQFQCPKCQMPIDVILKGLPDDLSITPEIDYEHEWHIEEEAKQ